MPFQDKTSGLKPLLPPSQHPWGAGAGCGTPLGCNAEFPASKATYGWASTENANDVTSTAAAVSTLGFCSQPGFRLVLSTFSPLWSPPGHALLLPPIYSQAGGCSCRCLQPVSIVSFQASVKSGNVDSQLTLAGSLSSCQMEQIRGQLNYLFFLYYSSNFQIFLSGWKLNLCRQALWVQAQALPFYKLCEN